MPEGVLRLVRRVAIFTIRVMDVKGEVRTLSGVQPELQQVKIALDRGHFDEEGKDKKR